LNVKYLFVLWVESAEGRKTSAILNRLPGYEVRSVLHLPSNCDDLGFTFQVHGCGFEPV